MWTAIAAGFGLVASGALKNGWHGDDTSLWWPVLMPAGQVDPNLAAGGVLLVLAPLIKIVTVPVAGTATRGAWLNLAIVVVVITSAVAAVLDGGGL